MTSPIVLDELHLTLFGPSDLPAAKVRAARRVLARPRFRALLRAAVRQVLDRSEATRPLTADVSQ